MTNEIVQVGEARVNITWDGQNGDLPDTVNRDATDTDIKRWATEAVRTGGIPGISADVNADFSNFVVDRFEPNEVRQWSMIVLRPKTPFGV